MIKVIAIAVAYYLLGLAAILPTEQNLKAACHPTFTDRQALVAPIVWPITYLSSLELENKC